ncbi:phosphodiester glycosidase family protein [Acinetobacter sp. ANC 3813]|uniref:phosphodiester glycosidase family protein n=1 Tax=Acinetobacter sp. ANC 3813 TaxID=1977873 RepID=UPI002696725C|nr:phosphodiester glycosidase family protein [Acinetobacter sp. ANC 3813]
MKLGNAKGFSRSAGLGAFVLLFSWSIHAQTQSWRTEKPMAALTVKVSSLQHLQLYLYDEKKQPYLSFERLSSALDHQCQRMQFAMNAGMFHADFSPVGLYVEDAKQLHALNRVKQGFGNFLIQPNGVLAWSDRKAVIQTTDQFAQSRFKPQFATQSGPMLVIDGKINPNFLRDASSRKIRNGVGLKGQALYFVISREPVTFYQFAAYFKNTLNIDHALYLDGSLSSIYDAQLKVHDAFRPLGPMLAYSTAPACGIN